MSSKSSNRILVKFMDESTKENVKSFIQEKHHPKKLELKKYQRHSHTEVLEVNDDDDIEGIVKELHNHAEVHYAQQDYILYACSNSDPVEDFSKQWGLQNTGQKDKWGNPGSSNVDIDIEGAWKITMGSEDVVVAVIDTGADLNHIDLKENIYKAPSGTVIDLRAFNGKLLNGNPSEWDFVENDDEDYDSLTDSNHGTLVSGIIAASIDHGKIVGVAPKTKLLPLKIMSKNSCTTSDAIEAIEYCKALGIKIANCSWGGYDENPALMFHMKDADILFICAAGNKGDDTDQKPFYPACYDIPNVIAVAAVNNTGDLWMMSNYGSKIDVAAPGTGIYSTISCADNESYGYDSGTSLATPYVTGIAALLLSANKSISVAEMKNHIITTCTPLAALKGKVASNGLVNASKALKNG